MKFFDWIQRNLFGNIFILLKNVYVIFSTFVKFIVQRKNDIASLSAESVVKVTSSEAERKARYNEMISGHGPGEYESSVRNLLAFSIVVWLVSLFFLIAGLFHLHIMYIIFGSMSLLFSIFALGYPIVIIKKRERLTYQEFLNIILIKKEFFSVVPLLKTNVRS